MSYILKRIELNQTHYYSRRLYRAKATNSYSWPNGAAITRMLFVTFLLAVQEASDKKSALNKGQICQIIYSYLHCREDHSINYRTVVHSHMPHQTWCHSILVRMCSIYHICALYLIEMTWTRSISYFLFIVVISFHYEYQIREGRSSNDAQLFIRSCKYKSCYESLSLGGNCTSSNDSLYFISLRSQAHRIFYKSDNASLPNLFMKQMFLYFSVFAVNMDGCAKPTSETFHWLWTPFTVCRLLMHSAHLLVSSYKARNAILISTLRRFPIF